MKQEIRRGKHKKQVMLFDTKFCFLIDLERTLSYAFARCMRSYTKSDVISRFLCAKITFFKTQAGGGSAPPDPPIFSAFGDTARSSMTGT